MTTRRIGITVAGALALVGMFAVTATHEPDGYDSLTVEQAAAFTEFDLYWVGEEFDGLPLSDVLTETGSVDFLYGDCHATSDQGCGLPLDIQVSPACDRNLSSLDLEASHQGTIRGVPVAVFSEEAGEPTGAEPAALENVDDVGHVEVYTGDVTVVLFGYPGDRLLRAVEALRPVDGQADPTAQLPPPLEGALEGRLSCRGPDDE